MKITVKAIPPSNNKFIGRNAIREYQEEKTAWHWLIKAAILKKPQEPYEKAVVKITYFFPDRRRRDPDNFSGKLILDPLVREKIIKDDSFFNIKLELAAEIDRENPRTEIEVLEVKHGR